MEMKAQNLLNLKMNPSQHWNRDATPDFENVIAGVHKTGTVAAVFDSSEKAEACLRDVIEADLGLSINMSTSIEGAHKAATCCGIHRHSVEYSLGFADPHDHLLSGHECDIYVVETGRNDNIHSKLREGARKHQSRRRWQ
jgi:hypothetical protein